MYGPIAILISLCLILVVMLFDAGNLTNYRYTATIVDKWHEESCTPILDGNGQYIGESCGDDYALVLNVEGRRVQQLVSNRKFHTFKIGQPVVYSYWLGRLGFKHSPKIKPISSTQIASK